MIAIFELNRTILLKFCTRVLWNILRTISYWHFAAKIRFVGQKHNFWCQNDLFARFSTLRPIISLPGARGEPLVACNNVQRCQKDMCTNFCPNPIKIDEVITDFLTIF